MWIDRHEIGSGKEMNDSVPSVHLQLVLRATLSCWCYEGVEPQSMEFNLFLLSYSHGDKFTKNQFTNYGK